MSRRDPLGGEHVKSDLVKHGVPLTMAHFRALAPPDCHGAMMRCPGCNGTAFAPEVDVRHAELVLWCQACNAPRARIAIAAGGA